MYSLIVSLDDPCRASYGMSFGDTVIKDITSDREALESEIALYNRLNLAPVHVFDALDNFLAYR